MSNNNKKSEDLIDRRNLSEIVEIILRPDKKRDRCPKVPKITTLEEFGLIIKTVEKKIKNGEIHPIDIDFVKVYRTIESMIDRTRIDENVEQLSKTTDLFEQKLIEFRKFLENIAVTTDIGSFLRKYGCNENVMAELYRRVYRPVAKIAYIPVPMLTSIFISLTGRKKAHTGTVIRSPRPDKSGIELQLPQSGRSTEYKKRLLLEDLSGRLPVNYADFLMSIEDKKKRYEYFLLILSLLTEGELQLDRKTGVIRRSKR